MGLVTNTTALSLIEACKRQGVRRSVLLAETRLSEASLAPEDRLSQPDLHELWKAALELTGDPDLSIHAAESTPPGAYGTLDFLMSHAPTLGDGLDRAARYFPLIHTGVRLKIAEGPHECALDVGSNPHPEAARPAGEFSLAVFALRARQSIGSDLTFLRVECAYEEPQNRVEMDRFFRSPLHFNQASNRLVFSRPDWQRTPQKSEPALFQVLVDHAARIEKELPDDSSCTSRVRQLLTDELKGGRPQAAHVAKRLGLSERSLGRRLKDEATSFSQILDDIRQRYAAAYLREKRLSQGEVAHLLGFSDLSSFHRAHRRWTGKAPGAV